MTINHFYIKGRAFILIVFFTFCTLGVFAQEEKDTSTSDQTTWQLLKYDVGNIFKGVGYSYTRPLHWKGKQWGTFGGVVAGTGALYLFDDQTSEYFRNRSEDIPQTLKDFGENYGSPQNIYNQFWCLSYRAFH